MIVKATPSKSVADQAVREFGPFANYDEAASLMHQLAVQGCYLKVTIVVDEAQPESAGDVHVHIHGADADEIMRTLGRKAARG